MRKLLDEISVIPGVSGSCVFDRNRGVICRKLKADLPKDITDNVGINFIRLLQMAGMNKLEIKSALFRFDRYWLVGTPLDKGVILLTICDLQANCSLIASTAVMLVEDLRNQLQRSFDRAPGNEPAGKDSGEEVDGDVRRHYAEIEQALASAIGPVAGMIMSDCISRWKQSGTPTAVRLPELMSTLAEEIEDPDLLADFQSRLKHLF